ncbi:disease resistance protein RGA2-like [Phragmites australis]|uniref:disease resistance protein RGA2-like n=1 Tax=Phragmites australis TaxID=29695 RepID=UPI002D7869C2|nr:disease resistance protein RGA2-like [Phragmites australis]
MEALQWILSAGVNIREATQLNDELDRLRTTLPKARFLVSRGEWGRSKDKELAMLLSQLKDSTYDAEDLLRELDDQVLRQKIEDADRSRAGQLLSSSLNLAKKFIYGSKTRVKETQDKLDNSVAAIEGVLNFMGLNVEPVQLMPETSSVIGAPQVFGRDTERDLVIEMLGVTIGLEDKRDQMIKLLGVPLTGGCGSAESNGKREAAAAEGGGGNGVTSTSRAKRLKGNSSSAGFAETNRTDNVSVLPIVGIGGVGKTTLAQLIYNDPRVKHHFEVRVWVCVSDLFDKKRITKEIVESITGKEYNRSCSLNYLQETLKEKLPKLQKFLFVLDDVWPNANDEWEAFFAPLREGREGSMVLVTTRSPKVADLVTTSNCKPVQLEGLPSDIFWEFFRKCAFGKDCPESYPHLQDIGQSISSRLCGSPLAAKTLGRLLNMELTERHWRNVQDSELWELPHHENEILPALQLSYLYLPQELKRCFTFCSIFPKDYSFERDKIVGMWVAEGFIAPVGNMHLEDVGITYLDELRSRFLFQSDPKSPDRAIYVMHDLIHDMAMSVSADECILMKDLSYQEQKRMPHTVRHMSVEVSGESMSRMRDIQYLNKLHSLRFEKKLNVEIKWFNQLSNILYLSLKGCTLVKLPESIYDLTSLRYLDISGSCVLELPEKFWCLYSLQFFDAPRSYLRRFHQDITKPMSLRHLVLPPTASKALSEIRGLGNLSCLRNLSEFRVGIENGRKIGELKFMNRLSGTLSIRSLRNVRSTEEAAEARLFDKQYLKELLLDWEDESTSGSGQLRRGDSGVVEGLRPNSRIESLKVHEFLGDRFSPTWFRPEDLTTLRSLVLYRCLYLKSLSIPCIASLEQLELKEVGIESLTTFADRRTQHASSSSSNGIASFALTRLTSLRLFGCNKLANLDQFLSPENLPSLKSLFLEYCDDLVSIPVHSFVGFVCLQDLKICGCAKLVCPREMVLPPSLLRLTLSDCGEFDRSLAACLENLTSLTDLQLVHCLNIIFIPLSSIAGTKRLVVRYCPELSSIGGSHGLSSIQHAELSDCPKLTEVEQPYKKNTALQKEHIEILQKDLLKFWSTPDWNKFLSTP